MPCYLRVISLFVVLLLAVGSPSGRPLWLQIVAARMLHARNADGLSAELLRLRRVRRRVYRRWLRL